MVHFAVAAISDRRRRSEIDATRNPNRTSARNVKINRPEFPAGRKFARNFVDCGSQRVSLLVEGSLGVKLRSGRRCQVSGIGCQIKNADGHLAREEAHGQAGNSTGGDVQSPR